MADGVGRVKTITLTAEEVVMAEVALRARVVALGDQIMMYGNGALANQLQRMQGELMVLLGKVRG